MSRRLSGRAGNRIVGRAELVEWCERLGHDPNRVSQIVITPTAVTVEYVHPVAADAPPPGEER